MEYVPRQLEDWEKFVAFTVVFDRYETVCGTAAGVIRRRDGPMSEAFGEQRPPLMIESQTPDHLVSGTLIYSQIDAPDVTVIEHPFDELAAEDFPTSLAKVMPDAKLVTFWSNLDTTTRQEHGYKVTFGSETIRYVRLTRGYELGHWTWEASGLQQAFENAERLSRNNIWHRLDRPLLFDYAAAMGIDPERTLFDRDFAQSVYYRPLPPHKPETVQDMTSDHSIAAEVAEIAGVRARLPEMDDAEFAETAQSMGKLIYWDRELSVIRRRAHDSAERAKTTKGRERAQWKVVEGLSQWRSDMEALGMTRGINWLKRDFDPVMKELGSKTAAYKAYRELFPNRWKFWDKGSMRF